MTQAFAQDEPNLVNNPIDVSSDTFLSRSDPLSLPSTTSLSQTSQTPFPPNFPTNLDARYRENSTTIRLEYICSTPSIIWTTSRK